MIHAPIRVHSSLLLAAALCVSCTGPEAGDAASEETLGEPGSAGADGLVVESRQGSLATDQRRLAYRRLQLDSATRLEAFHVDGRHTRFRLRVPTEGRNPVERATRFLREYGPAFGLDDVRRQVHPVGFEESDLRETVVFELLHRGARLHGGGVHVHLRGNEVVGVSLSQSFAQGPIPSPQISASDAQEQVLARWRGAELVGRAELEIEDRALANGGSPRPLPVFRVPIRMYDGAQEVVSVDGLTGDILRADTELVRSTPPNIEINDQKGVASFLDETCFTSVTPDCTEDPCTSTPEVMAAHAHAHALHELFESEFNFSGWDDDGAQVEAWVNLHPAELANIGAAAAYKPVCGQMVLPGGVIPPGIFGHEYFHGVDDHTFDLDQGPHSGAVKEHAANVFGFRYMHSTGLTGWDLTAGTGIGSPSNFGTPASPNHMQSFNPDPDDDGHKNRPILDTMGRFLITGSSPQSPVAVDAVGESTATQLYFKVLMGDIDSSLTMQQFMIHMRATAVDMEDAGLVGPNTNLVCSVKNAGMAVGLGGGADENCDGLDDIYEITGPPVDGDGIPADSDNCPNTYNPMQADLDGDGEGDACEADLDGDGIPFPDDNCVDVQNAMQVDSDGDGIGDNCDDDADNDGIVDGVDNCEDAPNASQNDGDGDGIGNACDSDKDGDEVSDVVDNCVGSDNPDQEDEDGDGIGDACDRCLGFAHSDNSDLDGDGEGDVCDDDDDDDGVDDVDDNCPRRQNPNQEDSDGDGEGDACDPQLLAKLEAGIDVDALEFHSFGLNLPLGPCNPLPGDPWDNWRESKNDRVVRLFSAFAVRVSAGDARGHRIATATSERVGRDLYETTLVLPGTLAQAYDANSSPYKDLIIGTDAPGGRGRMQLTASCPTP